MKLSTTIKLGRKQAGMTQSELAKKLNVTPQVISQYERGVKVPKFETRKRIADALNISVCYFLDDESKKEYIEKFGTPEEKQNLALEESSSNCSSPLFQGLFKAYDTLPDSSLSPKSESELKEIDEMNHDLMQIKESLSELNKKGCAEAIKRVRELTLIPEYKKE